MESDLNSIANQFGQFSEQAKDTVTDTVTAYTAIKKAIADYEADYLTFKGLANAIKPHVGL